MLSIGYSEISISIRAEEEIIMSSYYFIGIKVPATLRDLIDTYNTKYNFSEMYKVIPHPDDLHVTLFYVGGLPDPSLPILKKKLQVIAEKNPTFNILIDGLSYFGSSAGPRVVYLSVEESLALSTLQKEVIETIAVQLDRPISDRFIPHITIAKKRKTTDKLLIQKEQWEPIKIPISSFALFTIHPDQSPKYEEIEIFKLN